LTYRPHPSDLHVAIIMDGNGRWATRRGLPRTFGHRAGLDAVRRTLEGAPDLGISTLTLYAFSSDNWRRPPIEVEALMSLFERYLRTETRRCRDEGLRLTVIGRRDRLDPHLLRQVEAAERTTRHGQRLHVRLAVDYSGRDAILEAARDRQPGPEPWDRAHFERRLKAAIHSPSEVCDPDLLIRTGGEKRLSDFLLWECAYAELWFTDLLWPDFDQNELERAVVDFRTRQRRFGALPEPASLAGPLPERRLA
jgi:undecaprenyl diphosphate synthase